MRASRSSGASGRGAAQFLRGVAAAGLLVGCASSAPPTYERTLTSQPPQIGGVPVEPRMRRHADQLAELRNAVYDVDFARAGAAARIILGHPLLVRETKGGRLSPVTDARAAHFLALEARMREATSNVAAAADACDREALVRAFDAVTQTCHACHVHYAQSRPRTRHP